MSHTANQPAPLQGITIDEGGLYRVVAAPQHGQQDVGHAPGGATDRFALHCGNCLLDQAEDTPALEAVFLNRLAFTRDRLLVMTGAPRKNAALHKPSGQTHAIDHGRVTLAEAGDRLNLGPPHKGLRTYLCLRPSDANTQHLRQRMRPDFASLCKTADPQNAIRITAGPEFHTLASPDHLTDQPWRLTDQISDLGLRLETARPTASMPMVATPPEITSGPVNDGTVQLTPNGPLILLRQRTTLGGYPRVANVIDVDIDRLAQYRPREVLRFRWVPPEKAVALYQQREADLAALKQQCRGRVNPRVNP